MKGNAMHACGKRLCSSQSENKTPHDKNSLQDVNVSCNLAVPIFTIIKIENIIYQGSCAFLAHINCQGNFEVYS